MTGTISAFARAAVRKRVEAQMTATVQILRGQLGAMDPTTLKVGGLQNSTVIYEGNARIHTLSGEGSLSLGDGQIDQRQVVISIPWDAPIPQRDDVVIIGNDDEADTTVDGLALRIVEVAGGTLFGDARRLSCVAWGPSRYWSTP